MSAAAPVSETAWFRGSGGKGAWTDGVEWSCRSVVAGIAGAAAVRGGRRGYPQPRPLEGVRAPSAATVACVGFLLVSHGNLLLDLTCFVMTRSIMRVSPARRTCERPWSALAPGDCVDQS